MVVGLLGLARGQNDTAATTSTDSAEGIAAGIGIGIGSGGGNDPNHGGPIHYPPTPSSTCSAKTVYITTTTPDRCPPRATTTVKITETCTVTVTSKKR
jgi:hypothetical protein